MALWQSGRTARDVAVGRGGEACAGAADSGGGPGQGAEPGEPQGPTPAARRVPGCDAAEGGGGTENLRRVGR